MTVVEFSPHTECLAREPGICKVCKERVVPKESYIVKVEGKGWVHTSCANDLRRVKEIREEHGVEEAA